MEKNSLYIKENSIIRILDIKDNNALIIDCIKLTVPKWIDLFDLADYAECAEDVLSAETNIYPLPIDSLDSDSRRYALERYTIIAAVLPYISDNKERCCAVSRVAAHYKISKQTVNNLLCLYLSYQSIYVLAPKKHIYDRPLTQDEKNMRWALNKFFYTQRKNSLQTAYTLMLKEKYCNSSGLLLPDYPTIHQFRYFYRKHKNMQTFYISRDGLKNYQRNNRPLTGNGIQEFAPVVGFGMLDATVCDIYLVNEAGRVVGRPILTACIDAYSSLCCGYSLSWEGGVYSLRSLMLNVISDKTELCQKHGIKIQPEDWNCNALPGVLVTDMGKEYVSDTFGQITDLGVTVENLPPYRPELKGAVEKFFDVIQGLFKPYLKGKGIVESDYQERGAHDYRKDARLTMVDFENILLRCIIYYNNQRIIKNFPFTDTMLNSGIKPYASEIWNYGLNQAGANTVQIDRDSLILTLLPRTVGRFSRKGFVVNGLRYKNDSYTERFLVGGNATAAYNPDDVSVVWLLENGAYTPFELIESRFAGKDISLVESIKATQNQMIKAATADNIQAKINLADYITTVAAAAVVQGNTDIKGIRDNRKREQIETHIDYIKDGARNG